MNKQTPRKIIAFSGPIGCGKSVAADYLVDTYDFVKINFKDELIKEVRNKFPDLLQVLKRRTKSETVAEMFLNKPYPAEIRALLQNYGTEVRRKDDRDYWVKRWWALVREQDKVVCDDLRFLNEFQWAKLVHATVYKIERYEAEKNFEKAKHASETDQRKFTEDFTISNNGTKESLYKKLDELML